MQNITDRSLRLAREYPGEGVKVMIASLPHDGELRLDLLVCANGAVCRAEQGPAVPLSEVVKLFGSAPPSGV